ncbi:hypothetical protein GCM10017635_21760 [Paracoccus kondratievae]|uniref:Uncharacterized protein n=1 Tax=Paracoccus kondratievae TaxID=135740 RepID=A0AAD3NZ79_9RHOB|nr:hypothetical protein GCM10017635_21760 [Paracoccus kondratievae]
MYLRGGRQNARPRICPDNDTGQRPGLRIGAGKRQVAQPAIVTVLRGGTFIALGIKPDGARMTTGADDHLFQRAGECRGQMAGHRRPGRHLAGQNGQGHHDEREKASDLVMDGLVAHTPCLGKRPFASLTLIKNRSV